MFASPFYSILIAASLISALSTDDVLWSSPAEGSVYHSGDTLTAVWKPSLSQSGGSSSFSLCDQTNDCGSVVWPAVRKLDDGFREASFIIPDITSGTTCRLQMEDDYGSASSSPEFTLSPAVPATNQPKPESSLVVPVDGPAQLPLSGLASFNSAPQDVPLSEAPPLDLNTGSRLPVPGPASSFVVDNASPEMLPSSRRPWFTSTSILPVISGGSLGEDAPTPELKPDNLRDHIDQRTPNSSSSSNDGPSNIGEFAADAPPMSQVHLPPSSDTTPTPLAPYSQLFTTSHTTPLPVAAIAVPLSFAAVIGIVATALVAYNRRKASRNEAQKTAAISAINGNMNLLEARNTSFWSRSSAIRVVLPPLPDQADQEKTTVLGRLTALCLSSVPPPDDHEDVAHQQEKHADGVPALPSQQFDEIPLSPAMHPPPHVRNGVSSGDMNRLTTSSAGSVSPVEGSPTASGSGGLYDAVSKAFSARLS